jgi:hypothetical protein
MLKTKIKRINPEKSNKMIYAVVAGLAVILIAFFMAIFFTGGSGNKLPANILAYLKHTEGLTDIQIMDAEKKVLIVFNSDSKNAGNFEKIAYYAALRLSSHWPDCQVLLAKNQATRIVYSVQVKNGAIASEGPVQTGTDLP